MLYLHTIFVMPLNRIFMNFSEFRGVIGVGSTWNDKFAPHRVLLLPPDITCEDSDKFHHGTSYFSGSIRIQ